MMMGAISRYWTCTQMNTRLSVARSAAATTVSVGCQRKAGGGDQTDHADEFEDSESSRTPRAIQTCRGNAP